MILSLIESLFILIRLILFAIGYSVLIFTVTWLLIRFFKKTKPVLRWYAVLIFFGEIIALFFFFVYLSQTYWFHRGSLDWARIPLGYSAEWVKGDMFSPRLVFNSDGEPASTVSPTDLRVDSVALQGKYLCGSNNEIFFVINLETKKKSVFAAVEEYNQFATSNRYPLAAEFKSFNKSFTEYWGGWRFWLMP